MGKAKAEETVVQQEEQESTPVEQPTEDAPAQSSGESQQAAPQETPQSDNKPAPEQTADYWKSKYDGQSGYITRLKNEIGTKDQVIADLEAKVASLTQQIQALTGEKETLVTEAEQLRQFKALTEKQQGVRSVIAKDFPELVSAYDKGLMIGAENLEGDALSDYLTKFREHMGIAVQETLAGTTPPPPMGGQQHNAGATIEQLQDALLHSVPDTPEWNRMNEQYLTLLQQKQARGEL